MAQLTRLPQAQNVLSRFYQSSYTVYVEGDDDFTFWDNIYPHMLPGVKIKFVAAGNSLIIDQYADDIIKYNTNLIVIRDQDYLWAGSMKKHPRVIYTYGHSLENCLYSVENISKIISIATKTRNKYKTSTLRWLKDFADRLEDLQALEAANDHLKRGVQILGKNSSIVLAAHNSELIDLTKVSAIYAFKASRFTSSEISIYRTRLALRKRPKYMLIRGHFMSLAVLNYINAQIKLFKGVHSPTKYTHDGLFAQMIGQAIPSNLNKADAKHLKRSLEAAFSSILLIR